MFGKPTVVVLGAGASVEVGMPAGITLLQQISSRLTGIAADGARTAGDMVLYRAIEAGGLPAGHIPETLNYMGQALTPRS